MISTEIWKKIIGCGCISSKGVGDLGFVDPKMDLQQYLNILKTNLKGSTN